MTNATKRRLISDLKKINNDPPISGITASPYSDNIMLWKAVIYGPDDTLWEGGIF